MDLTCFLQKKLFCASIVVRILTWRRQVFRPSQDSTSRLPSLLQRLFDWSGLLPLFVSSPFMDVSSRWRQDDELRMEKAITSSASQISLNFGKTWR